MTNADNFIPILFKVLLAFICMNMLVNAFLLFTRKLKIYKLMAIFWPTLLCVFAILSIFQTDPFEIAMAYSGHIVSCTIFAMIGFEAIGRKFPIKKYVVGYAFSFPATYLLYKAGAGFTLIATPFAIATGAPLLHAFYLIMVKDRAKTTRLQKFLGVTYLLQAIHCADFAIFRMVPDTQIWGWLVSYFIYDTLAILLPAIALEENGMTESARLQRLVDERTAELNRSLKENEDLLKVVLHDISSPIMTMRFYLAAMKQNPENEALIEKVKKSQSAMERIVLQVKDLYGKKHRKDRLHLKGVLLEDCFSEVAFIFAQKLERKNITLLFNNELPEGTKVLADQTTLTHSVLSNLVSNALKFSSPHTIIRVTAKKTGQNSIVLEVRDQGPGISPEIIRSVMLEQDLESSEGTSGETGTGFGLSIVKSFVDSYGGQLEFDPRYPQTHPTEHGTNIRITLHEA